MVRIADGERAVAERLERTAGESYQSPRISGPVDHLRPGQAHALAPCAWKALVGGDLPVPGVMCELDATADELRTAGEILVEPTDRLGEVGGRLGRRVLRRGMADVADVQTLRAREQLVRGDGLPDVEEKVMSSLHQQRRAGEGVSLRSDER